MNNAKITDPNLLLQAGIDPNTKLPIRMTDSGSQLEKDYQAMISEMDRQDFFNKGTWYNLPGDLEGELIERILYYRGQGAFFYMKENDTFYFLPYSLAGNIDVYGRYNKITPVAFGGNNSDDKAWIPGLEFIPVKDITTLDIEDIESSCVLLSDRSKGLSQTITPRSVLNKSLINTMAEVLPMARTNLLSNSGVKGMRVNSEADAANVKMASRSISKAAKSGDPWIPVVGNIDFQDLTSGNTMSTEEYLEYFQSLDNFRMKTHGLESGGIFEKKSHMLQDEADINSGKGSRILDDTTKQRQEFCTLCNILYGLNMWYEPNESTVNNDRNMDGDVSYDKMDDMIGGMDNGI